jgi:hypothetical protein
MVSQKIECSRQCQVSLFLEMLNFTLKLEVKVQKLEKTENLRIRLTFPVPPQIMQGW